MLGFFIGIEYKAYQISSAIQNSLKEFSNETIKTSTKSNTEKTVINKDIGDTVELATLNFKVKKIEETTTLQAKYSQPVIASENTKFVVMDVDITNTTKSPFSHSDAWLIIIDDQGRTFNPYNSISSVDNYLNMRELAPNITENGKIVYEVPQDAKKYYFVIQKGGTSEEYHIALN